MKRKTITILTAAALLSIAAAGIGTAHAYFTTYVQASGTKQIRLGDTTTFEEGWNGSEKTLVVENSADSAKPVFVRAKGFAPSEMNLTYAGENWTEGGDGYWYYGSPEEGIAVLPGKATTTLSVSVGDIPEAESDAEFTVVLIYETTPAVEDGDAAYLPADWHMDVAKTEGGTNA